MPYGKMKEKELEAVQALNIELYTVKQVAYLLRVSERTVMNYLKDGRIKGQKVGGKWRITKAEIERFVNGE